MKLDPMAVASELRKLTKLRPSLAVVLGSGFDGVAESLRATSEIEYARLPGFPVPEVEGHSGKLSIGYLGPAPAVILNGRSHYYEGHSMETITFPVRVLAAFGVKDLVLTNAAGGINPRFKAGDIMGLVDHLNLMGTTPLRGPRQFGLTRFVDLSAVYDRRLRRLFRAAAKQIRLRLRWGVYAAVCGPCYETPVEIRALAKLGADAVGMSTVPEAIVARQCGMAVAGLSCITNPAAGRSKKLLAHEDVLSMARKMQGAASDLIRRFAELYAADKSTQGPRPTA
jgi:purine-nucleoside phosphorylase